LCEPLRTSQAKFHGTVPDAWEGFADMIQPLGLPKEKSGAWQDDPWGALAGGPKLPGIKENQKVPEARRGKENLPQPQADIQSTFKPPARAGPDALAMTNLVKRFPTLSLDEIAAALDAEGGHAGRAAKILQEAAAAAQATASIRRARKAPEKKVPKRESSLERVQERADKVDWNKADPKKWKFRTKEFDGTYSLSSFDPPPIFQVKGQVTKGAKKMKGDPARYCGLFYQSDMFTFPAKDQIHSLVERSKGNITVEEKDDGGFTWMEAMYHALPKVKVMPDKFTDSMTFEDKSLGAPWCPGRGDGCADVPSISVIGDVDPFDVMQGGIGDCWLLCALSAISEFTGAIKQLFKKTEDIDLMPKATFNTYTVTLYDVSTWKPVDIIIDERLCTKPGGNELLGCSPSITGDLWACYIEKAMAIHCGGWNNIIGGQCTHAWRMLTGCKDQYTFEQKDNGKWTCGGDFNPNTKSWERTANSRDDGFTGCWPMEWPKIGGGGKRGSTVTSKNLFERMCAWDDANYIMACGSAGSSDKDKTDGIVDNHAYTILACVNNVAGTKFDMIKVRNPWGNGEFENGAWDDDGPNWDKYPKVKEALAPAMNADDGTFWMEKDEFFKYFKTVYLCAMDMSEFIEEEEDEQEESQKDSEL